MARLSDSRLRSARGSPRRFGGSYDANLEGFEDIEIRYGILKMNTMCLR